MSGTWLYFHGDMEGITIPAVPGDYQVVFEGGEIGTCYWFQRDIYIGGWDSNEPVIAWLRPDGVESVVN